jgi:hypothetical protein
MPSTRRLPSSSDLHTWARCEKALGADRVGSQDLGAAIEALGTVVDVEDGPKSGSNADERAELA